MILWNHFLKLNILITVVEEGRTGDVSKGLLYF